MWWLEKAGDKINQSIKGLRDEAEWSEDQVKMKMDQFVPPLGSFSSFYCLEIGAEDQSKEGF